MKGLVEFVHGEIYKIAFINHLNESMDILVINVITG